MSRNIKNLDYEPLHFDGYGTLMEYLQSEEFKNDWVFRAQPVCYDLETSIERTCNGWNIPFADADIIEKTMVREFRRLYDGEDRQNVLDDTLYCLSLLRHYFAPSRLLDFSYSYYVALYFGLEVAYDESNLKSERSFALWCINANELESEVRKRYGGVDGFLEEFNARGSINKRTGESFDFQYMDNRFPMVTPENPATIHKRLHLQQGLFMCPGNIKMTFMDNLRATFCTKERCRQLVRKLTCELNVSHLEKAFKDLMRMGMTRENLFPGLDGFAQAMKYRMWFYRELGETIKKAEGW